MSEKISSSSPSNAAPGTAGRGESTAAAPHPPADMARPEDIARRLRDRGITPTQQRIELATILLARRQHLCAEQLLAMANAEGAAVSKATVYNTLRLFARRGLVREVLVDPAKVFFDSNTSDHYHLYDVDTGELTDCELSQEAMGDVDFAKLAKLPAHSKVDRVDLVVRVRSHSTSATE